MPYSKSYTYADGTVLTAANQNLNDEAAKHYVNQEVTQGDLASTFDTEDIQRGELEPITSSHSFTTGHIHGLSNGVDQVSRAYFTSHIKPSIQTVNDWYVYTPLYETGTEVNMEYDGIVLYNFGGTFASSPNDVQANGFWDSVIFLQVTDLSTGDVTRYGNTRAYTYEETDVISTAASGNTDPFGATGQPSSTLGDEDPENQYSVRRWCGFCQSISLDKGRYLFTVVVNAKVEKGYTSARSFTIETLYV